jgi:hypothetical protein
MWDRNRRTHLRGELDAYYALFYGLTRDELRYILDPKDVYGPHFPGHTFRVLKEEGGEALRRVPQLASGAGAFDDLASRHGSGKTSPACFEE